MFFDINNIGGKIKCLAALFFWLGIGVSIIIGFAMLIAGCVDGVLGTAIIGLVLMIFGSLAAWINCWLLYGYGQLIENSDRIVENTRQTAPKPKVEKFYKYGDELLSEEEYKKRMKNL